MASLRERLATLSSARGGRAAAGSRPLSPVAAERRAGVSICEQVFRLDSRRWLPELQAADPCGVQLISNLRFESSNTSDWIFLDVETTGLAGGTGTYAFLVGLGRLRPEGFCVRQYFLCDLAAERELLAQVAAQLDGKLLVTYNGKLFDAPLLDTRFRLARRASPFEALPHLDLLYPARRLWKLRLGTARLLELERALLGHERDDDAPGELIPQLYFDFLQRGDERRLEAVFRHNADDLLTLAALAARLLTLAAAPEHTHEDSIELVGLGRLFEHADDPVRAALLYEQALADHLPADYSRTARLRLSFLYKRRRDYEAAVALWHELSDGRPSVDRIALIALEQLAMCYEHRLGEPEKAAEATRRALQVLDSAMAAERERRRERLLSRLQRLRRKQANLYADRDVCARGVQRAATVLPSWSRFRAGGL
jgi:hypothetical protein